MRGKRRGSLDVHFRGRTMGWASRVRRSAGLETLHVHRFFDEGRRYDLNGVVVKMLRRLSYAWWNPGGSVVSKEL